MFLTDFSLYSKPKVKMKIKYVFGVIGALISMSALSQNGIVAAYCFNGNANDASVNGHHATVRGATLTSDRYGISNSAYYFDGIDDFIEFPPDSFLNDHFTHAAWVMPSSIPSATAVTRERSAAIISIGNHGADQFMKLSNEPALNQFGFTTGGYQNGSGVVVLHKNSQPNLNQWYHVVSVKNAYGMYLYINGVLIDSVAQSPTSTNYTTTPKAIIGARNGATMQHFHGKIDDVKLYNKPLSKSEIRKLYLRVSCGDTCYNTVYDTVTYYDTIPVYDTVVVYDTIKVKTSLNKFNDDVIYKFYPNPTSGKVKVDLPIKDEPFKLFVRNINGQIIREDSYSSMGLIEVMLPKESGIYFIQIVSNSFNDSVRILKE